MSIFIGSGSISNVFYSSGPGDIPSSGSFLQLQKLQFGGTSGSSEMTWTDANGITTTVINKAVSIANSIPVSGAVGWQFAGWETQVGIANTAAGLGIPSQSIQGYFPGDTTNVSYTIQFFGTLGKLPAGNCLHCIGNPNSGEGGPTGEWKFCSSSNANQVNIQYRGLIGNEPFVAVDYTSGSATGITIVYDASSVSASIYQNGILKGNVGAFNDEPTIFCTGSGFGVDGNRFIRCFQALRPDRPGFNGQLGSFYIWNRTLNADEVLRAYNFASNGGTNEAETVYLGNQLVFTKPIPATTTTTTTTTSTTTTTTTTAAPLLPASGAIIAIEKSGWTNTGSIWNNASGGISVVGAPLPGTGSNGFWQFDGSADYITASRELITSSFQQGGAQNQDWTVLFYGTIGSLTTRRAFMGNPKYNQQTGAPFSGSDIIFRRDDPAGLPADKFSVNVRTGRSLGVNGSQAYTITGSYVSGAITNMALVWDNPTLSLYQNGVLVSSFASSSWVGPSIFFNSASGFDTRIFSNANTDTSPFNGTLGAYYAYNRALTTTEISQSAQYFATNL